jgi:demethylmenaquinone methyltransferase/2-methoxy-6-polyprenyl-1,4-benzoquinol methylase
MTADNKFTPHNPARNVLPDATSTESKKAQVSDMFDRIAGRYDFLNHFLSLGIDKGWRRKAIREVSSVNPSLILDVATGTADLALAAVPLAPKHITGIDISAGMLDVGRQKIADRGLAQTIDLQLGDSEAMPFADQSFDAVMCAYGVRNFENLTTGLTEMCRVLRRGGKVVILEFSQPVGFPIKQGYQFYFRYILPALGRLVSKHSSAYTYLPASVSAFPQGAEFCAILSHCGFINPKARPLTFGITTLYTAFRPE